MSQSCTTTTKIRIQFFVIERFLPRSPFIVRGTYSRIRMVLLLLILMIEAAEKPPLIQVCA